KIRELAAARERAERLAVARGTIARSWRQLEAATRAVSELVSAILADAADDDVEALARKLAEWRIATQAVEHHARTFASATTTVKRLTGEDASAPAPDQD